MADVPAAHEALTDAEEALVKLDKLCCEPGRSPRMAALGEVVTAARVHLRAVEDGGRTDDLIGALEDAGARLGHLQVTCCAENRLPLYSRMLEDLTKVQLEVNRAAGVGH